MPHHKTEFCVCAFLTLSVLIWREHAISSLSICYVPSSKHMVISDFSCSFQYKLCAQCKLYTSINICLFIWHLMTDLMGKKCIAYCPFRAKHSFPQKMNLASGQEISRPQPCRESWSHHQRVCWKCPLGVDQTKAAAFSTAFCIGDWQNFETIQTSFKFSENLFSSLTSEYLKLYINASPCFCWSFY